MVHQIIALFLLFSTTAQAAAPTLTLHWHGEKRPDCHKLVEAFLAELRGLASDRIIELEAVGEAPAADSLPLTCEDRDAIVAGGVPLRYLTKAGGFDANDWLVFQRRHLRSPDVEAGPAELRGHDYKENRPLNPELVRAATPVEATSTSSGSLFQRWWFWTLIGAAGAGAYALTRTGKGQATGAVEIH